MGAYTEIVDFTLGSNATSFTVSNFGTITKDDFIKVVGTFTAVSSFIDIHLTANSSVNTNYHHQSLRADASSVAASRQNRPAIHFGNSGTDFSGVTLGYLKLSENDRLNMFFNDARRVFNSDTSSIPVVNFLYSTSSGATFSSGITSLTFSAGNTIKAGSRIQIYKLDAEKEADITVTSNTTQVDISNLSIDKDSEYLLVSDVTAGIASNYFLTPNDLTTRTDYHSQSIIGNGSTASAIRFNSPFYMVNVENPGLSYTHIKLSNIGAFTFQSYNLRGTGNSDLRLSNFFGSSTAENITSINKLNLVASETNGIGTGSRFTLYKLYE